MKATTLLLLLAALVATTTTQAQVPPLINYQGRVAVQGTNFDGTGQFKFALVNSDGTQTYWSNDGTSVGGSEPGSGVSLAVAKGLYSVLLGDTAVANMNPLPVSTFSNSDVRLRVWFDDGANGSQLLSPDQRLAPMAYLADGAVQSPAIAPNAVTSTNIAPGAVNGSHVAAGSLDFSRLNVPAAPGAGQVLGFDGQSFVWTTPSGGGGSSVWSLNGTSTYYNAGNVGIGTTTPTSKLEVRTATHASGFLHSTTSTSLGSYIGPGTTYGYGGWLGTFTNDPLNFFVNNGDPAVTVLPNGKVGIGTTNPTSQLQLEAQDALAIEGYQPFVTFWDTSAPTGQFGGPSRSRIQAVGGDINLFTESYLNNSKPLSYVHLESSTGNLGLGTATPETKLEVHTSTGEYGFMQSDGAIKVASYIGGSSSGATGGWIGTKSNHPFYLFVNGGQPALTVNTDSTVSVKVLSITGGADVAEPFPMEEEVIEKGSVVVIDERHPGRLKRSTHSYDKRVAGIVSGANGINPGIALHQDGVIEGSQNVALSGRVYVAADASASPIEPGDLLTTSDVPGHAMKAVDDSKAQGAVLGKAMSSLKGGRGLVLVLVSLQ